MNPIDRLTERFGDFPGIGPRQARRFVEFLLSRDASYLDELARQVSGLKKSVARCQNCRRRFPITASSHKLCSICRDQSRDAATLLIVEKAVDLEAMERSGEYHGYYFVVGSAANINKKGMKNADSVAPKALPDLLGRIAKAKELKEVVLALSATPSGEYLSDLIAKELHPVAEARGIAISILGRGLSTGTELEYSDRETLKNALENRKKK